MNIRLMALLALTVLILTAFTFIDGSDASSDTVYGTSEGGAKLITFDPGSDASDGYTSYCRRRQRKKKSREFGERTENR